MNVFDQMVARYSVGESTRNTTYEVMQEIILAGLYRGGFFNKAAFYGGTCLRIFHDMKRFSEDMDFSLIAPDVDFKLEDYFLSIIQEFQAVGKEVVISKKEKKTFGRVESAFLKENSAVYDVKFQTEKSIKIKIEVDVDPPMKFDTEQNYYPSLFLYDTLFCSPDLYAGKCTLLFSEMETAGKRT